MRIGVDVGGTNTDAAAMDGDRVVAWAKVPSTADVTTGIVGAMRSAMADGEVSPISVRAVMIGTTHFTNAVIEAKRLAPTACVRLGLPATEAVPPLVDWPERLRRAIGDHVYLCHGGHEYDGREISPLDHGELRRVAADIATKGIRSVAVTSVFSPVNADAELAAAELIAAVLPGVSVSLSSEIGTLGLLERENATILNASLRPLSEEIVAAFTAAAATTEIAAPVFITQNDGTLMSAPRARAYPVATFASGPTNSMRGAAFLSGVAEAAVVDVGGTTADVGMLVRGFPRQAATAVEIGGVRTNFRMPDILSIGVGGGSLVRMTGSGTAVGPDSVGRELATRSMVFGGDTLTATDVAVAAGLADIGDRSLVSAVDRTLVVDAVARIQSAIAETVDRMKITGEAVPVVVVGGGSVLVADDLPGACAVVRPEHFAVANAIGAAIAQVGSEVDRVYALDEIGRDAALAAARTQAVTGAITAGADPGTVDVVDIEEIPLTYLPGNATRIRVKAIGDLSIE